MDRFSNILKQRLEATQSGPLAHPSTDTLVAFVERGLSNSHRESVLAHLSVCPECREAVRLATPEVAIANAQPATFSFSRALQFPSAIRWASLAAALAVAVGVGVIAYEHEPRQQPSPFSSTQEKVGSPVAQTTAKANEETKSDSLQSSASKSEAPTALAKQSKPAARSAEVHHEDILAKKQTKTTGMISAMAIAPPPVAGSKERDIYTSRTKALPTAPEAQPTLADSRTADSSLTVVQASPKAGSASQTVEVTASPDADVNLVGGAPSNFGAGAGVPGSAALIEPRPAEKSAELQPATTKTLYAASVSGAPAKARRAYGVLAFVHWTISAAGQLQRRALDGTLTIVEPVKGAIIRAVAAEGIEVWAGGSQNPPSPKNVQPRAVLFHSSDAGETWKTVDGPWKGAIERVNMEGFNSLTVVTTDGTWNTGDAGKSWNKP